MLGGSLIKLLIEYIHSFNIRYMYIIYYLSAFISQAPKAINCDSIKSYKWTITGGSTEVTSDTMATFTADAGGDSIKFSVWTINNGNNKSDKPATHTVITDDLRESMCFCIYNTFISILCI